MHARPLALPPRLSATLLSTLLAAGCASSGGQAHHERPPVTFVVDGSAPRAVTTRIGQNYWSWNGYGNNMPAVQPLVPALHLQLLRAGGYNNDAEKSTGDYGSDPFGPAQIDAFVAYARAIGAEPILQVPLLRNLKAHGGAADPAEAAELVRWANVTRGHAIRYWEIGNEPDLYAGADVPGYTRDRFIADFKAFAAAMKAVDPTIRILGPELSWKYHPNQPRGSENDWLTPFVAQARGAYDVIAIHRYPFDAAHATVPAAMGDVETFTGFVRKLQALLAEEAPGIPLAITEANITWDGDPAHSVHPASPQTLPAAIWMADNLAAARELGLWAQLPWSLSEGWTLGLVDPATRRPRPQYHGFQLVSGHLGPTALSATAPPGFSAYASRSAADDATVVLVLNKHGTDDEGTFAFSGGAGTPAQGFRAVLPAYSISVVTFPDGGGAPSVLRYSQAEVDAGTGPAQVQ